MPTRSEEHSIEGRGLASSRGLTRAMLCVGFVFMLAGCGEPSPRELKNRQEFEALLTAVSLKNPKELEQDARRIEERHASGQLSDSAHKEICEIIDKARGGDWGGAERQAYEYREKRPYFR